MPCKIYQNGEISTLLHFLKLAFYNVIAKTLIYITKYNAKILFK